MHELRFSAGVHRVNDGNMATFYVMNTGVNRNRWSVTEDALEQALLTLIGKPLGCGPNYSTDRHYQDQLLLGEFVETSKPNGYALGEARIDDVECWLRLTSGEWGPVSVVVTSYLEKCSVCGLDLTGLDDPFIHDCILEGGHLVVESFTFDRVDFVDVPAYPQAGLIKSSDMVVPIELLASFSGSQVGAAGPLGVSQDQQVKEMEIEERLSMVESGLESAIERLGMFEEEFGSDSSKERLENIESRLKAVREKITQIETGLEQGAPKAKMEEGKDELEAAMDDARHRLFGRRLS